MIKRILSTRFVRLVSPIVVLLAILTALAAVYSMVNAEQDYPVGENASELGVIEYRVEHNKDLTTVYFSHTEKDKSGKLIIRPDTTDNSVSLDLSQENGQAISIRWSPGSGEFTLKDDKSRSAHFVFVEKGWVADNAESQKILETYTENVKLTGAIFADFDSEKEEIDSQSIAQPEVTPCEGQNQTSISCPCYGVKVRGDCYKTTRSEACRCATNRANVKCWNQWCIGCCEFVGPDCDCACLIEDYFCACGRGGWSCSGPCH